MVRTLDFSPIWWEAIGGFYTGKQLDLINSWGARTHKAERGEAGRAAGSLLRSPGGVSWCLDQGGPGGGCETRLDSGDSL